MSTLCGWASINESGKINGGQPGDQNGREVRTGNWYSFGQTVVLRFKDRRKAEAAAEAMKKICDNDVVGYCQGHRTSLYDALERVGWNPDALTETCETDCSSLMAPVLKIAGINVSKNIYTGNMVNAIMITGEFDKLTGGKYTDTGDNLMTGDIIVAPGSHTIMALEDGCNIDNSADDYSKEENNQTGETQSDNPTVPYGVSKEATFIGYVNTGALNIRKQPDPDADRLVSYPCVTRNTEVGVCGSATAPNGKLWYYIYIDGDKGRKYGYVNASYISAK